jgi:hypothetical protein
VDPFVRLLYWSKLPNQGSLHALTCVKQNQNTAMGDARLLFGKNGRQWLTNCSVLKTQLAQEGGELNINRG